MSYFQGELIAAALRGFVGLLIGMGVMAAVAFQDKPPVKTKCEEVCAAIEKLAGEKGWDVKCKCDAKESALIIDRFRTNDVLMF